MKIEEILKDAESILAAVYAAHQEVDEDFDQDDLLDNILMQLGQNFRMLGHMGGVIEGNGIAWDLDAYYFLHPSPIDDKWHLMSLWFDDNWGKWQFNGSGTIASDDLSFEAAAVELLRNFVKPGTDEESLFDYNLMMDHWSKKVEEKNLKHPKEERSKGSGLHRILEIFTRQFRS